MASSVRWAIASFVVLLSGLGAAGAQIIEFALSTPGAHKDRQTRTWTDTSPHRRGFVQANGVKLHYLDWGGQGEILVFLTGLGDNAHIFDDLAPEFTDHFHVLAMTRRGFGESDCPATGYDVSTRVEDLRGFLDALRINRVILAGHSIAGDELTGFAATYPERVEKLIYLDAAVDPAIDPAAKDIRAREEPHAPKTPKEALVSLDALLNYLSRRLSLTNPSRALEASVRDSYLVHPDGSVERRTPDSVYRAILRGFAFASLDYTKIKQPTLSFYEDPSTASSVEEQKELAEFINDNVALIKKSGPEIQVERVAGSRHYLFIDHQAEVTRKMMVFLKIESGRPLVHN